jgi:hypothetical protein
VRREASPREHDRVIRRGIDEWRVHEADARAVPGARAPTCLICESVEVIRRLWLYPRDWGSLDDDALWNICDGPAS